MDGTGILSQPFIAALGKDAVATVVRYPTDRELDYAALAVVARAALPSTGKYVLLGESFSGPIAIALAASSPPGLVGLVLSCTFAISPAPVSSSLRKLNEILPAIRLPVFLLSPVLLGRFATSALRNLLSTALSQVSPRVFRSRLSDVLKVDVRSELEVVNVPVVYLRALRDRVVHRGAGDLVSKLNRHARIVEFDAPHLLLQCQPVQAASVVKAFMRELGRDI